MVGPWMVGPWPPQHCDAYYDDVLQPREPCDGEPDGRLRSLCEALGEQRAHINKMQTVARRLAEMCNVIAQLQGTAPDCRCRQCELRGGTCAEGC